MGSPRQAYWIGLPFPSPGNLLDPGIEPVTPALTGKFFTSEAAGKPKYFNLKKKKKRVLQGDKCYEETNKNKWKKIKEKKNIAHRVDKMSHVLCDAVKECVVLIGWLRKTH